MLNSLDVNFKGMTAIIPMVSVANIPQLAADLIIHNTSCSKSALFWHDAFLPYVGPNPFSEESDVLCTTIEAYCCKEKNLVIFQFRSPIVGGAKSLSFVKQLCTWLKSWEVEKVVILSSIYSHIRFDDEIQDESEFSEFRYVESSLFIDKHHQEIANLQWSPFLQGLRKESCSEDDQLGINHIGAGPSALLYNECISSELPVILILKFASDGYNVPDAERYVKYLNLWLKFVSSVENLQHPVSWKSLKETNLPDEMY